MISRQSFLRWRTPDDRCGIDRDRFVFRVWRQIDSAAPVVVKVWLVLEHETLHADFDHVMTASALDGMFAVLDPAFQSEICRFRTIEAVVEARMVCVRKRDDELIFVLSHFTERDRLFR